MTVYFEYWRKSIQGAVLIEILFRKRGLGSSGTEHLIPTNVRTSPHGPERLLERGRARGNNYLRGCTCRRGLSGYFTTTTMTMTETMGRLLRLTNAAARHLADVLSATSTARRVSRGRSGSARRCPSSTPDGPDGRPRTAGPRVSAGARRLPGPGAVRAPQPQRLRTAPIQNRMISNRYQIRY